MQADWWSVDMFLPKSKAIREFLDSLGKPKNIDGECYNNEPEIIEPLKDEGAKLANDIASRYFACDSLNKSSPIRVKPKPKIKIHDTGLGGKYWYCESESDKSIIIGIGDTPKLAYKDWLKAVIQ